jgi:transcriptional regulator with XRE-family HTH domain
MIDRSQLLYYAIVFSSMQEASALLEAFMKATGLKQQEIAVRAGVSQSTVSRMRKGGAKRGSDPQNRICTYIQKEGTALMANKERTLLLEAFNRIWDGSEEHAVAVVKIIDALQGLRPASKQKE